MRVDRLLPLAQLPSFHSIGVGDRYRRNAGYGRFGLWLRALHEAEFAQEPAASFLGVHQAILSSRPILVLGSGDGRHHAGGSIYLGLIVGLFRFLSWAAWRR